MIVDESLLSVVDLIYGAATDEALWPQVLHQLIATTDSQAASFYTLRNGEPPQLTTFDYINFDPAFIDEYLDRMAPHDPTIQHLVSHPGERIVHDTSFISEAEKDRHAYYDWHGRFSDTRHRVVGTFTPMAQIQSGVAVHRTRRKGDFTADGIRQFDLIFRHVERALEIGFRLGTLGAMQRATLDLLDRNPLAILLLDQAAHVIFANRAASTLNAARDGIVIAKSGITLSRALDHQRLQRLIGAALATVSGTGLSPAGAMLAARPSHKRPLSILVSPLSTDAFGRHRIRPAIAIVIADPEQADSLPVDRLRRLYGLTQAEARLTHRLAMGEELRAAAAALDISYATARSQLAAIFRKTETQRQGELIMLLLKTVPLLLSQSRT